MEKNRGKQGQIESLADAAIGVSPIVAEQMPALAPWLNKCLHWHHG
ncbi:hypothetical protein Za10_0632 [Zymomonas mobilis subsp. mobilis NCIMB 11163]|nr:hypothetical protein Za10_0632 [Zymomonas mobilis subsp. mobilis NCIMB 11163]